MSTPIMRRVWPALVRVFVIVCAQVVAAGLVDAAPVTYQHDAQGRVTKATYEDGTVVDYSYDANGNRTTAGVTLGPDTTPPSVPSGLAATAVSQSQVNLSWTASTDNRGVAGYKLERCTGSSCSTFAQIATPTATSYPDTGRSPGTTYVYRVRANDAANNHSGYSTVASATTPDTSAPTPPGMPNFTNLAMTSATASWSAATDDVDVTGYDYRLNAGAWQSLGEVLSVNLTGLSAGTTYTFDVRARDAANNVGPASSGTFTTPDTVSPSAPGTPQFTGINMSSATASWGQATDNVGVVGYDYRLNSGTWVSLGNVLSANVTGLAPATSYTFYVRARDAASNTGPASSGSFTTVDTEAPTKPIGLVGSAPNSNTVNLSWNPSTDNVGVAGYKIFRNGGQLGTSASASYTDNTVVGTVTYSYAVSAYDAANNNSQQSNTVTITTPDTILPTTPTGLMASAAGPTQVNLSWNASTDAGGSGLAGYRVYRGGSQITTTTSTSYSDTAVSPLTSYSYTVEAYDNANNRSGPSNSASVTTPPLPVQGSLNKASWNWYRAGSNPPFVPSPVVVTPSGGTGTGYTFAWERVSGDTLTTATAPTSNSTQWTRPAGTLNVTYTSVWRCRVRDSAGSTGYTANVTVTFLREVGN